MENVLGCEIYRNDVENGDAGRITLYTFGSMILWTLSKLPLFIM